MEKDWTLFGWSATGANVHNPLPEGSTKIASLLSSLT